MVVYHCGCKIKIHLSIELRVTTMAWFIIYSQIKSYRANWQQNQNLPTAVSSLRKASNIVESSLDCDLLFCCVWELDVVHGQLIYCIHDLWESLAIESCDMPTLCPSSCWNDPVAKMLRVNSICTCRGTGLDRCVWCWLQTVSEIHNNSSWEPKAFKEELARL